MCCFMIKAVRWILQALRYCFFSQNSVPPSAEQGKLCRLYFLSFPFSSSFCLHIGCVGFDLWGFFSLFLPVIPCTEAFGVDCT